MDGLLRDLLYALRMMGRRPWFSLVTVMVLGLGIGGNIAVMSVLDAVLFRPPAVRAPGELVWVRGTALEHRRSSLLSHPDFQDCRAANVFSGLAAYAATSVALSEQGVPEKVRAHVVSTDYFDLLGVPMERGRAFLPDEGTVPLARPVAVMSASLWRRRFGSDPGIFQREIVLNGRHFNVVGIASGTFSGLEMGDPVDLWIPLAMHAWVMPGAGDLLSDRGATELSVVGRLAPGMDRGRAAAAMESVAARLRQDHPAQHEGWTLAVQALRGGVSPDTRGEAGSLGALLASVSIAVLLIACANVAALLVGRAAERSHELSVRRALGATRARLVRQQLTESLLLSVCAAAASFLLAAWGLEALLSLLGVPHDLAVASSPGRRVLLYAVGLSCAAALAFGLIPAINASRSDPGVAGRDEHRLAGRIVRRSRLQMVLVVSQVSLSMILLVAAGLLLRTLQRSVKESPGFETQHVVAVTFDPGLLGYARDRALQLQNQLLERAGVIPGVRSASFTSVVPLSGTMAGNAVYPVPAEGSSGESRTFFADVWPGYFRTLDIPLLRGRDFNRGDVPGSPPVAIINGTLARALWGDGDPLGRQIRFGSDDAPPLTIVGVAADARYDEIGEAPAPFLYLPCLQLPPFRSETTLLVRTDGPADALVSQLRHELAALEPHMPLTRPGTLAQYVRERADKERGVSSLLAAAGGLALLLASLGLNGVMAFAVARRTRETGIRLALGARPADITRAFLAQGVRMALAGIAIGGVASILAARALVGMVFGAAPGDVGVYGLAAAALAGSAALASWAPAHRASRVDPMEALRES